MRTIIQPEDVTSPRERLELVKVLVRNVPNAGRSGMGEILTCSIALIIWDGEPRLGVRYDGQEQTPRGTPISNSHPTWFVVPRCIQPLFMPAIPVEHWDEVMTTFRFGVVAPGQVAAA